MSDSLVSASFGNQSYLPQPLTGLTSEKQRFKTNSVDANNNVIESYFEEFAYPANPRSHKNPCSTEVHFNSPGFVLVGLGAILDLISLILV